MHRETWKNAHQAVCSINFFSDSGIRLGSVTGFKVKNCIITDEYIYKIQKCDEVVIQFMKEDGYSAGQVIKVPFRRFTEKISRMAEFENEGYAVIQFSEDELADIPSLEIDFQYSYVIGDQVAVIGYHIDQDNMGMNCGILSSFFRTQNGRRYIQFDVSIKQGNSGSPLINMQTGKVIGVVGYRLSGISKSYEAFKKIIDENLKVLKKSEGKINIVDIDPVQVLIVNQHQLKQISREFYRSAAMSFGYAHELRTIQNYILIPENETSPLSEKDGIKA